MSDAHEEKTPQPQHPLPPKPQQRTQADGTTTRDDATDLGVPMLPGDDEEGQGPEDAFGKGPKRGDYSERVGDSNYRPHSIEPVKDAEPGEPQVEVVDQREHAENQGDTGGDKGGVDTPEAQGKTPK